MKKKMSFSAVVAALLLLIAASANALSYDSGSTFNLNAGYQITNFRKEPAAGGTENTKKMIIGVDKLLNGGDLSQDIELKNGDVIYVPKALFYVYGEVNRPGAYGL